MSVIYNKVNIIEPPPFNLSLKKVEKRDERGMAVNEHLTVHRPFLNVINYIDYQLRAFIIPAGAII
jgi:hypothetical protein